MTATAPPQTARTSRPADTRQIRRVPRALLTGAVLVAAVIGAVLLAVTTGPAGTDAGEALSALISPAAPALNALGIDLPSSGPALTGLVLGIRLPRILLAVLTGASLAVAGAVMQALFRNPLAEPGITGVSSGAATAAVLVIVLGGTAISAWMLPLSAFAGAVVAVFVVQAVAGLRGGSGPTLLLIGIAINAFLGAVIAATLANAPTSEDAQQAMFWLNGDLTGASWGDLRLAAIPIIIGTLCLLAMSSRLDLFLLGDEQAISTGIDVVRSRQLLLALAALVTASSVAVTGVISFVGLVIPHLVRLIAGGEHRRLLPISAAVGAVFLVLADVLARSIMHPVVLQTGTVTALVGAPVLLHLVAKKAR